MSHRDVKFDEQELVRIATEASGSKSCVKVSEYTTTPIKRLLHLVMDDGSYVVAKIYTPRAGRPHYVTASEVATMEFVRINNPLSDDGVNSHRPVTF